MNSLQPIHTGDALLNFGTDIRSQTTECKKSNKAANPPFSLKINRLLPMARSNMHGKFEFEIPKQTIFKVALLKINITPTDSRTVTATDRWTR